MNIEIKEDDYIEASEILREKYDLPLSEAIRRFVKDIIETREYKRWT